ncbi:Oxysterol-binding protein 2 [Wickerhamomyces ciferrii]|uniref:Oxysterol-binding protein 2 n=1 Tax=Wickerhamomyces ciferrii (strain ATCC 14091 / BCRC 22168 / CBS 111 / JCM 3599 / NBRC 0793 / NRRL Y-1031 F-60-10) TaxID=1206466 RepID=K0KVA2_WICCF|nr:Oxysterol-binding protein 2 [Wickerhamomyces ciferrii]CCH45827.1 Oxysterol-binding protein 2 [Wickerhamomyces ciferrii]
METIDVHSKSFVVKWIQIPDHSTVIFQLKPIKRSINFSIYRSLTSETYASNQNSPHLKPVDDHQHGPSGIIDESNNSSSTSLNRKRSNSVLSLEEKLKQSSMLKFNSYGTLNGNQLFKNEIKVEKGGMFAFIFDNTFAKSYSKKVLFNKFFIESDNGISSRRPTLTSSSSSINLPNPGQLHPKKGQYLQGYLLKKKRKKLQGFTKRFFILNFKYNTLSYYINESSLKTRGEMPVNLSTISAFKDENTFIIDSGMEIWTLKTLNKEDWDNWTNALNFIKFNSNVSTGPNTGISSQNIKKLTPIESHDPHLNPLESIDLQIDKISNNLNENEIQTTKLQLNELSLYVKSLLSQNKSNDQKAQPFAKELSPTGTSIFSQEFFDAQDFKNFNINHDNNITIDDNLDYDYEFDDLDDDDIDNHVILLPASNNNRNSKLKSLRNPSFQVDDASSSSSSNVSLTTELETSKTLDLNDDNDDLTPLPINETIKRRNDIPNSNTSPQSLFTFLRKNVGKDLSSISMPVTSNEPITILQKIAESFEFTQLLDQASLESQPDVKILKIATFAISNLSSSRVKERNLRKPFNPILGETFELIREDLGYRFIAEKINHKPQIFAINCESLNWEISFCLNPEQKYWGKSMELINKGIVTLRFKNSGEIYKWHQPNTMLKNIMAGEKYTEPINSVTISSSVGLKAIVEFKKPTGGFFNQAKSEELIIKVIGNGSNHHVLGKWTESLSLINDQNKSSQIIWSASELIKNYELKYGFTKFTSNLNQITSIEDGFIPKTDSRFRPDVKSYESGDFNKAETLKLQIEQRQRDKRQELVEKNQIHKPNWFKKIGDDELNYELIKGDQSYWNKRKNHDWNDIEELW